MRIILDFDYTLFDTAALKQAMKAAVRPFGVTTEQFVQAEALVKQHNGMYVLEDHLARMCPSQVNAARAAIAQVLADTSRFVYADATAFLQRHVQHTLILLSFGNPDWQRKKLETTGFFDAFDDILLVDQPKFGVFAADQMEAQTLLINDRGSEIDAIKKEYSQLTACWIRRPGTPYVNEPCQSADREVTDLSWSVEHFI